MNQNPTNYVLNGTIKQNRQQRRKAAKGRPFGNSGKNAIVTYRTGPTTVEKYKQVLPRVGNKTIVHWVQ